MKTSVAVRGDLVVVTVRLPRIHPKHNGNNFTKGIKLSEKGKRGYHIGKRELEGIG